eukprot:TRINITY_DN3875_c0_g1_i26.p1 TRINITY_DN3875_c0_g1~~TRINITY_DN3875_c0_g1_i26.p1  ORF type:complete len:110 (+),score=29.11 TRINITY_DN3875_c0_g1_i26:73-402(+)
MCIRDRSKSEDNIAYYGFRPQDSLNLHEAFSKKGTYPFRQPPHSLYMLIEMTRERYKHRLRSVGMTARFKDGPYEFDSCFESGNLDLSLIHICRCRRYAVCRSRWSPYH